MLCYIPWLIIHAPDHYEDIKPHKTQFIYYHYICAHILHLFILLY